MHNTKVDIKNSSTTQNEDLTASMMRYNALPITPAEVAKIQIPNFSSEEVHNRIKNFNEIKESYIAALMIKITKQV